MDYYWDKDLLGKYVLSRISRKPIERKFDVHFFGPRHVEAPAREPDVPVMGLPSIAEARVSSLPERLKGFTEWDFMRFHEILGFHGIIIGLNVILIGFHGILMEVWLDWMGFSGI